MGFILTASLGLGGFFGGITPAQAETASSIDEEINSLHEKLQAASQELKELTNKANETQEKIDEKNIEITDTKTEVENLQKEIVEIEKRIEARNEVLKERARSLQESGGTINYLEVLLGAQSFSDFINRTEAVATILSADKDILTEHQNDMDRVSEAKTEVETKLQSLETMVADLETMKKDTDLELQNLEAKENELHDEVDKLMEEKSELLAVAETNTQSASSNTQAVSVQGSGEFGWPAVGGIITSYQGTRWGRYHKGIDISGVSDRSILAANGGTVIVAGWHDDYGNYVKIDHGNGYTTLYGHMASLNVSTGQSVSKGTKIGVMGSTGRSTGMHLHFEVHKNGSLVNPMSVL